MNIYKKGDIVKGYVTGIEKYGIFISVDEKYSGLIHISEITSSYVRNIYDYVKIGEMIQARVIENEQNGKIKLSIKDMDYRIMRKKNNKIEETEKGFSTLTTLLNLWIEQKIDEITKKNKKNPKKR